MTNTLFLMIEKIGKLYTKKKTNLFFFLECGGSSQLHINGRSNDGYLGWSGKQSNNNKIPTLLENLRYFGITSLNICI